MQLSTFLARQITSRYGHVATPVFVDSLNSYIRFNGDTTIVDADHNLIVCDWNDADHRKSYPITDFPTWIEHWSDRIK